MAFGTINNSLATGIPLTEGGTGAITAAAARTNLGLGTGDSPTFTGSTLSGLTLGSVVFAGTTGVLSQNNANFFWDNTNKSIGIGTGTPGANLDITQAALTSGSPIGFRFTGGTHTTLTAAETVDISFNLNRTIQFTAGAAIATQRAFLIQAPTYSATAAQTITECATLYIENAPTAGVNVTFTNQALALWVDAGASRFDGNIGFFGVTPIGQGASVADATGGATIDAEARTAINALISRIEATGLIATI